MTIADITREEILAVYPRVAKIMADALGCDVEQVGLDVSLIDGLNAESIDFLDIVFSLERTFKVKIPRGKIVEDARGDLTAAAFEQKGYLTDVGLTGSVPSPLWIGSRRWNREGRPGDALPSPRDFRRSRPASWRRQSDSWPPG